MKRLFAAICIAVSLTALYGCPSVPIQGPQQSAVTLPDSPTQWAYASEVSLTAATNALADLHNAGIVVGANYAVAYDIQKRAHATLNDAKKAALAKDATKAKVLLKTLDSLIGQLAEYNGGKK